MKTALAKTQRFAPVLALAFSALTLPLIGGVSVARAGEQPSFSERTSRPANQPTSAFWSSAGLPFVVPGALPTMQSKAQSFSVNFEEVTNSCEPRKISLGKSTVAIAPSGKRGITVTIPTIPELKGRSGKRGKFSARAKVGKTIIKGIDGKFSIAGTVKDGGQIEFVFIAEYYKGKEPMCTTTWNGSGSKK